MLFKRIIDKIKGNEPFYPMVPISEVIDHYENTTELELYSSNFSYSGYGRLNLDDHPVYGSSNIIDSLIPYKSWWIQLFQERLIVIVSKSQHKIKEFIDVMDKLGVSYKGEIY